MAIVNGQWTGANDSGFWSGSLDDDNLVQLNRETNTAVGVVNGKVTDTYNVVSGATGVSASYNLINGLTLGFEGWLGTQQGETASTWREVYMQIYRDAERLRNFSDDELRHYNDLVQRLNTLASRLEQVYQIVSAFSGLLSNLQNSISQFKNDVKAWLHRIVSAVVAVISVALSPVYRLCRADGSRVSGQVTITPDFDVVYTPGSSVDYIDILSSSSNMETGQLIFQSMEIDKYMRFSPTDGIINNNHLYYSDELRQVIVRPYRNSGTVYLY